MTKDRERSKTELYKSAEYAANLFNLKCLGVLVLFTILSEILNETGVFHVEFLVMRIGAIIGGAFFLTPIVAFLVHDKVLKRSPSVAESDNFKVLIIIFIYLGVSLICVTLTHHALIIMSLPPLIAAQYRDQKRLFALILVLTVILVPIGVYGGFLLGAADRNLLKHMRIGESYTLFSRMNMLTAKRALDLLFHYVVPRTLSVVSIVLLASGVSRRNSRMLDKQAELSEKVQNEMEKQNRMQRRVIDDMAAIIETRDVDTGRHVVRTKKYVELLAREMQKDPAFSGELSDEYVNDIINAAPLHDVGKITVSDAILMKPARLTSEEFDEMKKHSEKGGEMVRNILSNLEDEGMLKAAEEIALYHHEKWDGSGYPKGLSGADIPLSARIMAVADVFDALVSERVYKAPISPDEALSIIEGESGTHFDPDIVKVMKRIAPEFKAVAQNE